MYPENVALFSSALDATDHKLVKLISEINPREIVKRFKGNPRDEFGFFQTRFKPLQETIERIIQSGMAEVLPLLPGRPVFEMGNDSYPARRQIEVLSEKASVIFHFKRNEKFTRYYPTVKLRGELIDFRARGAIIFCSHPAWMLCDGELFRFEPDVEGSKLKPFLSKEFIFIDKDKEDEYYKKFVLSIVEKYAVFARGFDIVAVREQPRFFLEVLEHDKHTLSIGRKVQYGDFMIPLEEKRNGRYKALMRKEGDDFTFFKVERHVEEEQRVRAILDGIKPNDGLLGWESVEKEACLQWIAQHNTELYDAGIEILQEGEHYKINLTRPEITMHMEEAGDWFDIRAVVRIGNFEIPFVQFRNHILRNKREYQLPDGTIAILPEQWFSDYRHLLEISEPTGEHSFRIRRYQAPLLYFPSQNNGRFRMQEAVQHLEHVPHVDPPQHLKATLRNYQQQGYNWLYFMKNLDMGCILADDMGLGKTLQTLALLQKELENGVKQPSMIVMPTSLIHNWRNEAHKFAPMLRVHCHTGISRTRDVSYFQQFDIVLTTYGIVRQDVEMLAQFPFHYVILDESQMIKNPESKTAHAVRKLVSRHRLSLTGTPIENTVMDIWSQMTFLNPGLLGSENFFRTFYVQPIEKDKDARRTAKLRRIIYPFILRRRKHQVEQDLPPRVENLHYCEMTEEQGTFYEETRSSYRNYLMELINTGAWKKNKLNILTGLQKLRQIAIHPRMIEREQFSIEQSGKYQEVRRLLKQIIDTKRSKVLVFSQFVKMLEIISEDLKAEGIRFNYLDGSTRDRQEQVDSFQKDKDIQVFLISLKAGGVGLNLTAADYVFILDPWWNPAVENQAIDRSHRIGQKRTVFFYKFITKDSIEEKILSLQRTKAQLSEDIITVEEDMYKSLDVKDLEELLQ
ncbi:MAG: ATP-dependent helicase [Bacteroidetes bacterium]|nr:MAG: ATP-dependent helicase [Bacteroidota bacterium]